MKKIDNLDVMSFMNGLVFFSPIALLVRTAAGVSVNDFFILQALLSISVFFLEIPTGKLSDKLGHKSTLVLSQIMLLSARILLLVAFVEKSMTFFVIEVFVEGLSVCFSSGTQSAYIYSTETNEIFVSKTAHVANCGTAGFVISTITYVVIYKFYGITGLLLATILANLVAVISSFGLKKEINEYKEDSHVVGSREIIKSICSVKTLWIIVLLACINIVYILINFFYVDKLMEIGISEMYMTPIILGYSVIQLTSEFILNKIQRFKDKIVFGVSFLLSGIMLCSLGLISNKIGIVMIMLLLPLAVDIPTYLLEEIQNRFVDEQGNDSHRAEIISIFNMGVNLVEIIFLFGSAVIAGFGAAMCFCVVGIAMMILGVVSYAKKGNIKENLDEKLQKNSERNVFCQ